MQRNKLHIAIFDQIFGVGGIEQVFIAYIKILVSNGYTVDLVVRRADENQLSRLPSSVRVVHLGDATFRHMPSRLRRYLKRSTISTLITGHQLDNFAAILANRLLCKKDRVRLIISQHSVPNADDDETGFLGKFFPLGKRLLYRFADSVIAVSEGVAQSLRQGGVPARKVHVIENPVDTKHIELNAAIALNISLPTIYIVFVGRLNAVKNVEFLIRSFECIELIALELVIVGDGPLRGSLEDQARRSPKSEKIHLLGNVTNPAPIVANARAIAIPSTSEGFSLVAVEAMALGITPVYTPNMGCQEVVGEEFGYCSQTFDDAQEFADMMVTAIKKPIDPQKLKARAAQFDSSNFSDRIKKLLPVI